MTHLTMEMLLSLREPGREPGDAAAREHLAGCPECQAELERLHQRVARLKALPPLRPAAIAGPVSPPGSGPSAPAKQPLRRAGRARRGGLDRARGRGRAVADARALGRATTDRAGHGALPGARERAPASYNPEGRMLDGRTAGIAQELEDRIARVDRELEVADLLEQQARDEPSCSSSGGSGWACSTPWWMSTSPAPATWGFEPRGES